MFNPIPGNRGFCCRKCGGSGYFTRESWDIYFYKEDKLVSTAKIECDECDGKGSYASAAKAAAGQKIKQKS